jgi:hypothetical protein
VSTLFSQLDGTTTCRHRVFCLLHGNRVFLPPCRTKDSLKPTLHTQHGEKIYRSRVLYNTIWPGDAKLMFQLLPAPKMGWWSTLLFLEHLCRPHGATIAFSGASTLMVLEPCMVVALEQANMGFFFGKHGRTPAITQPRKCRPCQGRRLPIRNIHGHHIAIGVEHLILLDNRFGCWITTGWASARTT